MLSTLYSHHLRASRLVDKSLLIIDTAPVQFDLLFLTRLRLQNACQKRTIFVTKKVVPALRTSPPADGNAKLDMLLAASEAQCFIEHCHAARWPSSDVEDWLDFVSAHRHLATCLLGHLTLEMQIILPLLCDERHHTSSSGGIFSTRVSQQNAFTSKTSLASHVQPRP